MKYRRKPLEVEAVQWSPTTTYTWTTKELQAWHRANGENAFYDGELWTPKTKRLCAGMYSVRFVLWSCPC